MTRVALTVLAGMLLATTALAAGEAVRPGDLLRVEVKGQPALSTTTNVLPDGTVPIMYVGNVPVAGKSEGEAAEAIGSALSSVLRNPRVTVTRGPRALADTFPEAGGRVEDMTTKIVELNNANAANISETLDGMTSEGGSISHDPDTNTLVITDFPEVVTNIESVISKLDALQTQQMQVRIQTKIAEVQVGAMKELGVRWFVQADESTGSYYPMPMQDTRLNSLYGAGADPIINEQVGGSRGGQNDATARARRYVDEPQFDRRLQLPVQIPRVGQLAYGFFNGSVDLGVMLDALAANDKAEILAEPNILTVNHKQARIEQIDEFPYTEYGTDAAGRASFSTRFLDIGIRLLVTPHVLADEAGRYVKMELEPEVSYAVGSSNGVPIRSVRSSDQIANVRDGQTLVVGGIYRSDKRNIDQRVPGLGKVPILGNLFKRTEKVDTQTELMVFVTPTIHDKPESVTWESMLDVAATANVEPVPEPPGTQGLMRRE